MRLSSLESRLAKLAAARQHKPHHTCTAAEREMRFSQLVAAAERGARYVRPRFIELLNLARARRDAAELTEFA
ncbi:MAG: hypothetical protein JF607_17455 [Burkholderiales bacterium]|jgi:hypothetical protein|nr:hypothetical protein [Burkholderiales bacterium]